MSCSTACRSGRWYGRYVRDYFYVEDGAAAYMLPAERLAADPSLAGQAFNFSNEAPISVLDLVKRIRGLMGSSLEPDVRNEVFGWRPPVRPRRRSRAHHRLVPRHPERGALTNISRDPWW